MRILSVTMVDMGLSQNWEDPDIPAFACICCVNGGNDDKPLEFIGLWGGQTCGMMEYIATPVEKPHSNVSLTRSHPLSSSGI
jgi:hypothetical protein